MTAEFENFLNFHFESIQNRNLEQYASTLFQSPKTSLIMLNGEEVQGYENIVNFHKKWFQDPDWSLTFSKRKVVVEGSTAVTLLDIHYKDKDENGKDVEFSYMLNIVFIKTESEGWKLLYDQNIKA